MTPSGKAHDDTAPDEGMHALVVPRDIVNSDSVFVVAWAVDDGAFVEAGAAVCDIETSKAVETLEAEYSGYLRQIAPVGAEVAIGGVLGFLVSSPDAPLPAEAAHAAQPSAAPGGSAGAVAGTIGAQGSSDAVQFSAKARQKIAELGLDESMFAGRAFVRESDVVELASKAGGADGRQGTGQTQRPDPRGAFHVEPLGPIQRRVARVMEQSVAAIPASCLERLVDLAPVRARARTLSQEAKSVVTEVDLLVEALARTCVAFPHFNAFVTPDYGLHVFEQVNVGVAVDIDGDLYVVVVKDAGAKSAVAIAKELRGLQYLAQRRRLTAEQLTGGTITMTSMLGRGIHRFQPIPYPQQAAIVGLADVQPGETRASLTLVFDHRVANGAQAAAFLAAIDDALQSTD